MDYERFMRTCGVLRRAYDSWDSLYWALVLEEMVDRWLYEGVPDDAENPWCQQGTR